NALQPGKETFVQPELSEILKRPDEGFLHDVRGLRVIRDLAHDKIIERALIALHQHPKGVSVSGLHCRDNFRVFHAISHQGIVVNRQNRTRIVTLESLETVGAKQGNSHSSCFARKKRWGVLGGIQSSSRAELVTVNNVVK